MKNALSVLLALAMTAAALTGCVGNNGKTATKETPFASAQAGDTAASEASKEPEAAGSDAPPAAFTLHIGALKGPTSMGLAELKDKADKGEANGSYQFSMVTAADELLGKIISGDLDVALIPSNMASILFNKTDHGINVLNINTLGVLYVVSADDSIKTIADLKAKTIYLTGKGTTPDYALQYLLKASKMSTDDVTLEYKSEAAEVASLLKENPEAIGLLPQPFVTVAMAQNDALKIVLDLTKEWDAAASENGGSLVTGVTICRSELLKEHAEAIETFLAEQKDSSEFANENVDKAAKLIAADGIIENAAIAEKAIPYCSITYIDGSEMERMLSGYLSALYEMNPATVGGELPSNDFYYEN